MAKLLRLALGSALLLGGALGGCGEREAREQPNGRDETTEQKRSALTTSLFQPYVAYATGSRPEAVAIGDLDGDGRKDVALLTSLSNDPANDYTVHVFLQDVDGSLKPRVKYPVGPSSTSMDIGDVNGDGRADVVVGIAPASGVSIGVLLQNASGTLDPMVSYPTVNSTNVKIGDFNGDGRMDVAGIAWSGDAVDVFLQTDTGTLAAPVTYHAPYGGWNELDAGDIDGDGRTDLIVMSGQTNNIPNVSLLLQTQGGSFGTAISYSVGTGVTTRGVALGDTNGDGRSDIVVSYNNSIARFLQNAAGALDPAVAYASQSVPSAVVMADVDADGRKDVLVTHNFNAIGVYRQFPSGDLGNEELHPIPSGSGYTPQGIAVGDINGDGRPDVVIAHPFSGLVVLRHLPDVSLALAVTAPVGGTFYPGVPLTVRWIVGDAVALDGFDLSMSLNGVSYTPLVGCTGLPGTARECTWAPTSVGFGTHLRVTARDSAGQTAFAESTFNVAAPVISLTQPQAMFVGTTATIGWIHNLPASDTVRVELSRDGGASYQTLAAAAPISGGSSTTGTFSWNVTGPDTTTARVRLTANGSVAASSSTNNFPIRTAALTVLAPAAGATIYGPSLLVGWNTNVLPAPTVRIELSRDGGATFQTIATAASNGPEGFTAQVSGPDTSNAVVRVTTNGPVTATGTSGTFTLLTPTLIVTNPPANATFLVGTPLSITWSSNLPTSTRGIVELSRDGGSTFQILSANVFNTGSFAWVVTGPATAAARVRITMSGTGAVIGTSGTFGIATPSLTVTGPAATVYVGASTAITWTHNLPATDTVRIEVSRDGGAFAALATAAPNSGSYTWNVTGSASAAQVRVTSNGAIAATGTSGTFGIVTPSLTVTAPTAGTAVYDSWLSVAWTNNVASATTVLIELSRDGGATFQTIAAAAPTGPTGGTFSGSAFGPDTTNAQVRVTTNGPVAVSGTSASFSMLAPSLTVTGPAAGSTLFAGTPLAITWSSTNLPVSMVSVELSRDGGGTFETLAAAAPNTGSFSWLVTGPDAAAVVVRVAVSSPVPLSSTSGTFSIVTPSLTVTGPAAGTLAYAGAPLTITWTDNLSAGNTVSIELSRNGGVTFATLAASAPDSGSFVWTATGPDTAEARVRVTSIGAVTASHVGATFQIVTPTVAVTSPTAGASWAIGTARTIAWSSNLPGGTTVRVELSRDGGASWTTLASAAAASGSLAWTATAPATAAALVRVSANDGVPAAGTSGTFAIGNPTLAVTAPVAGASWTIGAAQAITWTTNLLPTATVKIELSRNGGSTYTSLASAAPNTGSFVWTASGATSTTARVRVTANGFTASGVSGTFSIVAGSVRVTSPNTAVTWTVGTVHAISWTHNAGTAAQFKIEVSRGGIWSVITAAVAGGGATSGTYNWTVSAPKTTSAKIRITWTGNTAATDTSDVAFKIN